MRYTDSPARKIIMLIAWLIGVAVSGLGVFYFSSGPVDQAQVIEKKNIRPERRVKRATVNPRRARDAAMAKRRNNSNP